MKMGKRRRPQPPLLLKRGIIFILGACAFSFLAADYLQGETASCPTATIIGRVYDAGSGRPIDRAMARITAAGFDKSDATDGAGMYSITDVPCDRELKLTCKKTGYRPYTITFPALQGLTSYAFYTYDIPLASLMAGSIDYEEKQPDIIYGVEEAETGEEDKKHISGGEEYAPGIKPEEYKERRPPVESQVYALQEGDSGVDLGIETFSIDGFWIMQNPILFSEDPAGQEFEVIIRVSNFGPEDADNVGITLTIDGRNIDREIPAVRINSHEIVVIRTVVGEGEHNFETNVRHPRDTNQNNNTASGVVAIIEGAPPQADMALLNFTIDGRNVADNPMLPQGNGRHNVIMNCRNAGPDAVRNCSIILLVDGILAVFEDIDSFRATANWDFNRFLHFEAGRHQVVGVIRSSSQYTEINEENNVIRGAVTFEGAQPPPGDRRQTDLSVLIISVDGQQCRPVGRAPVIEIPFGEGGHRVCAMIRNNGQIDADAGAQLSIDGAIVGGFVGQDHLVPAGRALTLCEDFVFEAGIHTLTGTINPPLDSDDGNNSLSCSVDFTGAVEAQEEGEGVVVGDEDVDIGDEGVVVGDEDVDIGDEDGDRPPVVVQPPEEPVPVQPPAGQLPGGEPPVLGPAVAPQPGAQRPAEGLIPPRQLPVGQIEQPQLSPPVFGGGRKTVDRILQEEEELTKEGKEGPEEVAAKKYDEPLIKTTLLKWLLLILLLLHISSAVLLQIIAKKTSTPSRWLAWIPIANLYLAYKIAGKIRKG